MFHNITFFLIFVVILVFDQESVAVIMKKNPFPVDNGSTVDERDATESPTSREETAGPRARSPWTHRRPRSSRNSPRRPRDNRGTISTSPESLETPPRSPGAPSENSDADGNDSRDEILLRSPGEYVSLYDKMYIINRYQLFEYEVTRKLSVNLIYNVFLGTNS